METALHPSIRAALAISIRPLFAMIAALAAMAAAGADPAGEDEDPQAVDLGQIEVSAEAIEPPESPGMQTVQSDSVEIGEDQQVSFLTIEEVLDSMASVRVRSFGAPGSPSFLMLRGSDATHTLVLLDGVPLNDASTGFTDLSTVPAALLTDVTVIRGGHAAGAGPYHPGGVVLLGTGDPAPGLHGGISLTLGAYPLAPAGGSGADAGLELRSATDFFTFGAQRELSLWQSWFGGSVGILASGSFSSSENDFAYLSDGGTSYEPGDDMFLERRNAWHSAGSGLVRVSWLPDSLSRLAATILAHVSADGLPGLDVLPALEARLDRSRLHLTLGYERWKENLLSVPLLDCKGFFRWTSMEFSDPLGEISLSGTDSASSDSVAGFDLALHLLAGRGIVAGGSAGLSVERWVSSDRLDVGTGDTQAMRLLVDLGFDLSIPLGGPLAVVETSLDASIVHDVTIIPGASGSGTGFYVSPRAGLAVQPLGWLGISGSVAYVHRPPTFMEQFGNGGTFRGSAGLEPEKGVTADAGIDLALPEGIAGLLILEGRAAVFLSRLQDLISFIPNSQRTMIATNVADASIRGLEVALTLGWKGWARVDAGWTLLDPVDRSGIEPYDGLMLPGRPRHDLFVEVAVGHWGVELSWALDWMSGGFVDRVNLEPISGRAIHSLQARWNPAFAPGLALDLKWWNVGNEVVDNATVLSSTGLPQSRRKAVADVDGWPLPGSTLFLTLSYRR